jgi:hypothetical protein
MGIWESVIFMGHIYDILIYRTGKTRKSQKWTFLAFYRILPYPRQNTPKLALLGVFWPKVPFWRGLASFRESGQYLKTPVFDDNLPLLDVVYLNNQCKNNSNSYILFTNGNISIYYTV